MECFLLLGVEDILCAIKKDIKKMKKIKKNLMEAQDKFFLMDKIVRKKIFGEKFTRMILTYLDHLFDHESKSLSYFLEKYKQSLNGMLLFKFFL